MAGTNYFTTITNADGNSEDVALTDKAGDIFLSKGETFPSDGKAGYAKGAMFMDTNASATQVMYLNEGSNTSADFNIIDPAASGGAGANTTLNNLGSVAVNVSIISDTDSADDLGSSSIFWANSYVDRMYVNATAYLDGATGGKVDITGDVDISGGLVVSGAFSLSTLTTDTVVASTVNGTLTLDGNGSGAVNISSSGTGGITLGDDVTIATGKSLTLVLGSATLTDGDYVVTEGKITVDSTVDETSYIKRNQATTTGPVLELEDTNTGADDSVLLLDQKGTGNCKALEITHDGDEAAINISAGVARTGNVINIPMADQLAQTALDITGAAIGTSGEGIIHVDVTGALAGDAVRVDSTGTNATTSALFKGISTGAQAGATAGIVAHFQDTGATSATSYTVYIDSTNNEALHVDAGVVQFDEALTLGVDNTGADFKAFGATTVKFMVWDESADRLILTDATEMRFGGDESTDDGVKFVFDGTADFNIDVVNANDNINFGSTIDTDVIFHGGTAGKDVSWIAATDTMTFAADANLVVTSGATAGDGLVIPFGATASPTGTTQGSIYFEVDAKKLWIYDGTGWVGVTLA